MTAAKLPKEQFPHGACPFMSEVYIQPTSKLTMPVGSGPIPLGSSLGPSIQMIPIPCMGVDCQLWDDERLCCDLGPAREVWTHEQNLPNGALTGKSGADGSGDVVNALHSLQLVLEMLHKKLK
jgi:hypothetical protein